MTPRAVANDGVLQNGVSFNGGLRKFVHIRHRSSFRVPRHRHFWSVDKVERIVRQASAHNLPRLARRTLRRQGIVARQVMARIDPKSVERSTAIGIALFAASSIALQGFVVAQGSFSGRSSGGAQAAIVPAKSEMARNLADEPRDLITGAQTVVDPRARRTDRLTKFSAALRADGRALPRIASLVPADTIVAKPVAASDLGLRVSTFGPGSIKEPDPARGIAMASRLAGDTQTTMPRPTRVAFNGAPSALGATMRDFSTVVEAAPPPARAPGLHKRAGRPRVPNEIVQKVHFQDHTPERCLPNDLMNVIYDVAEKFGEVQILSTFRDPERNRRVGGAPHSYHLRCQAIDFRVRGRNPGLLQYLAARDEVGGLKRYPLGFYHIDTGPRRTW